MKVLSFGPDHPLHYTMKVVSFGPDHPPHTDDYGVKKLDGKEVVREISKIYSIIYYTHTPSLTGKIPPTWSDRRDNRYLFLSRQENNIHPLTLFRTGLAGSTHSLG